MRARPGYDFWVFSSWRTLREHTMASLHVIQEYKFDPVITMVDDGVCVDSLRKWMEILTPFFALLWISHINFSKILQQEKSASDLPLTSGRL